MSMTHAECQDLLLDLAYGELDAVRAAEVELHLAGCDECRAEQAKLNATRAAFAPILAAGSAGSAVFAGFAGFNEEPGPAFDSPILAAARAAAAASRAPKLAAAPPRSSRPPRKFHWMRAGLIGSIAAAAALAIIVSTGKTDKVIGEPPRSAEERAIAEKRGAEAKRAENAVAAISSSSAQAQAAAPAAPPPAPAPAPAIADDLRPSDAAKPEPPTQAADAPPPPPSPAPVQRRFAPPPPALKEKSLAVGSPVRAAAKREEPERDSSAVDGEGLAGSVSASNGAIARAGEGAGVAKSAPSALAGPSSSQPAGEERKDLFDKKRAKVEATPRPATEPTLETQASAARASGRLADAAALYVRAAHAALQPGSSLDASDDSTRAATAAEDFLAAIRCQLALGHIAEAEQVRAELAAVSPAQPDRLAQADAAISEASNRGR